jgi:hypothetical protein
VCGDRILFSLTSVFSHGFLNASLVQHMEGEEYIHWLCECFRCSKKYESFGLILTLMEFPVP